MQDVPGLRLAFAQAPSDLEGAVCAILPGAKNTGHDLDWLHRQGWSDWLRAHAAAGGHVLGICGGYQMLGTRVDDPDGIEGAPGAIPGLGLLPVQTVLQAPKTTTRTRFRWGTDAEGEGYEIHMGRTLRRGGEALFDVVARNGRACFETDGCSTENGQIRETYIHGCFDSPRVVQRWLAGFGPDGCTVRRPANRPTNGWGTISNAMWTWRRSSA